MGADLEQWLQLTLAPGIGPVAARRALSAFGEPAAVLRADPTHIAAVLGAPLAQSIVRGAPPGAVDAVLAWLTHPGNSIVTLADPEYPRSLLEISDPPVLLYARGRAELLARASIAIVGSRNATPQGLANATAFARALADAGLTVVSGLALGIDAAAHRGALDRVGSTIAVLGTGANVIYPKRNADLIAAIAQSGLVVSELPLGSPALAEHFPRRNRLISGLARGCLVIEAAIASGSLITARMAAEQGRDVFAIPGSIHSPLARGCHALIKQGAKLVESAADVLEELGPAYTTSARRARSAEPSVAGLTKREAKFLDAMGYAPVHPDTLCMQMDLTPDVVSAMLLGLEMSGHVASMPGGQFQRVCSTSSSTSSRPSTPPI